jgi:hypothetical protein
MHGYECHKTEKYYATYLTQRLMQRADLIHVTVILNNAITGQIQPFILEGSHHQQQQNFQVKL